MCPKSSLQHTFVEQPTVLACFCGDGDIVIESVKLNNRFIKLIVSLFLRKLLDPKIPDKQMVLKSS